MVKLSGEDSVSSSKNRYCFWIGQKCSESREIELRVCLNFTVLITNTLRTLLRIFPLTYLDKLVKKIFAGTANY